MIRKLCVLTIAAVISVSSVFAAVVNPEFVSVSAGSMTTTVVRTLPEPVSTDSVISFVYTDYDGTFADICTNFVTYASAWGIDLSKSDFELISEDGQTDAYRINLVLPDSVISAGAELLSVFEEAVNTVMRITDFEINPISEVTAATVVKE